jgi:uncharacterized protein (DUF2225 family)
VHYKEIEPLYFEIITCPDCWYSSSADVFDKAVSSLAPRLNAAMKIYKEEALAGIDNGDNINTVFKKFYLALECSKICYYESELITARLWLRISWIYADCGDAKMQSYAEYMALQEYKKAYEQTDMNAAQSQRVCIIIAELSIKREDLRTAKEFLRIIKTGKDSTPVYIRQAENRLEDIKQMQG